MSKPDLSSRHFQRKISRFCELRIVPIASKRSSSAIEAYLTKLIAHRMIPPLLNGRFDWTEIAHACRLGEELSGDLKKQIRIALDAILRWLGAPPVADDVRSPRQTSRSTSVQRGSEPKHISPSPEPLFEASTDPAAFQDALVYQMRRFGESYWQLYRAVVRLGETFDDKTLLSWIQGERVPRSVASYDILARIERRYRLPAGYFKAKLPHQARSLHGHDLSDITPAERRRIAWHLPDDFSSLPFSKREEILDWVRRVIISGSTDYRRYQAAASKQRYAIRFPGVTYGGGALSPRTSSLIANANNNTAETFEDPDLLSGVVDAPPRLAMEMADLIRFKTSTLTAIGFQRNGVWGEETAAQKIEHLGLMFGALAASPAGVVKGRGVPLSQLTFGLLIFPGVWD